MEQIVHREVVADMPLQILRIGDGLLQRRARIRLSDDIIDKQPLSQRGAEGVNHAHIHIGIGSLDLLCRGKVALIGARKSGREGNNEDVLSLLGKRLDVRQCLRGRDLKGLGHCAVS